MMKYVNSFDAIIGKTITGVGRTPAYEEFPGIVCLTFSDGSVTSNAVIAFEAESRQTMQIFVPDSFPMEAFSESEALRLGVYTKEEKESWRRQKELDALADEQAFRRRRYESVKREFDKLRMEFEPELLMETP